MTPQTNNNNIALYFYAPRSIQAADEIVFKARRMRSKTIVQMLRLIGRAVRHVTSEIVDAHKRRALALQLASMNDHQLKDIGVLRGSIDEFVGQITTKKPANDQMALDQSAPKVA